VKISVNVGPEWAILKEPLEGHLHDALSQVAAGERPEHSAGKLAAALEIIDTIESAYAAMVRGPRAVEEGEGG
jgi:hypothetical protein